MRAAGRPPRPAALPRASTKLLPKLQRQTIDVLVPVTSNLPSLGTSNVSRKLRRSSGSFVAKENPLQHELQNSKFGVRASSLRQTQLPLVEREFPLTVHFLSNWGDPNEITCSEIDFLTKDRKPIHKVKVVADRTAQNVDCLANHIMIKEEDEKIFTHAAPELGKPVTVYFIVTAKEAPQFVRIWNSKLPSALRQFDIFSGDDMLVCDEVPLGFGGVYSIKKCSFEKQVPWNPRAFQLDLESNDSKDADRFGRVLVQSATQISFEILETWSKTSPYIGLNCVEFFGIDGEPLPFSAVRTVSVQNATNQSSPFKIFKGTRRTMESEDMWLAERENEDPPVLNMKLSSPTKIVMIRIWNYNGGMDALECGVKKLRIRLDGNVVWWGRCHMAKGMTSKIFEGVTDVWLADKNHWEDCSSISVIQTTRKE